MSLCCGWNWTGQKTGIWGWKETENCSLISKCFQRWDMLCDIDINKMFCFMLLKKIFSERGSILLILSFKLPCNLQLCFVLILLMQSSSCLLAFMSTMQWKNIHVQHFHLTQLFLLFGVAKPKRTVTIFQFLSQNNSIKQSELIIFF